VFARKGCQSIVRLSATLKYLQRVQIWRKEFLRFQNTVFMGKFLYFILLGTGKFRDGIVKAERKACIWAKSDINRPPGMIRPADIFRPSGSGSKISN
jgi:hypothetical protein